MFVSIYLLAALLVSIYYAIRWKHRKFHELTRILGDGGISLPIIGAVHLFAGDGEAIMRGIETLGRQSMKMKKRGLMAGWLAHKFFVVIADPVIAEYVSRTCLEKHDVMYKSMNIVLGTSSIIAPVPIWREHRRMLAPTFCIRNIKQYTNVFVEQSKVLVEQVRPLLNSPIPSVKYYLKYAMDAITQSTLGVELNVQREAKTHPFLAGIENGAFLVAKRFVQPWLMSDFIYKLLPSYKIVQKYTVYYYDFINTIINSLRKNDKVKKSVGNKFKSLVELLVEASETEKGLSDSEIREEALGVAFAATETTGIAAAVVSHLLAEHPGVQEKVFEELIEVFGENERFTANEIFRLNYLNAAIKEALRMYPPVPIIVRVVEEDCELPCGVVLPKGSGILLHLMAINRNPDYWGADADQFRPERFLDSDLKHFAQFSTFSLGPRNCVGKSYAMTSLTVLIATVLRHYRIVPAPGSSGSGSADPTANRLRWTYAVTMKDINNFPVQLQLRDKIKK